MKQYFIIHLFITLLQVVEQRIVIFDEDSQVKSDNQFLPAATPANLSATVSTFNFPSKQLQLNITWSLIPGGRSPSSFNVHVWPQSESDAYCSSEPYYALIEDPNCTSWLISPRPMAESLHDTNNLSLQPGCSYIVRLEANPHNGRTYAQTEVKIPDCVEEICSCRHAEFLAKPEIRIIQLNISTVNITWFLPDLHNISSFTVRVGPKLVDGAKSAVYNLSWNQQIAASSNHFYHKLYSSSTTGRFAAVVRAVDFQNCLGPEGQRTFILDTNALNGQEIPLINEISWRLLLPIGSFLLFSVLAILYNQNCFSWFGILKSDKYFTDHSLFYSAIRMKSERVFRRSNSLQERNVLYIEKEIEDAKAQGEVDNFEISFNRLVFERQIGQGTFGNVFLARAEAIRGVPGTRLVAVKVLKAKVGAVEKEDFLEEISMLKKVGQHPNIVSLLACCTLKSEICMVMEFVPCGDLLKYLRNIRQKLNDRKASITSMSDGMYSTTCTETTSLNSHIFSTALSEECCQLDYELDHRELHNFALQIAKGMAHLEAKRITHRDLAARNILIDNNKVLKISDFGLSRRGVYVNTRRRKVPLRWLSVEAMRDSVYSSKSDVWAFAILLWEIGTLGGFPYPTVADYDLLQHLKDGNRLDQPEIVSKQLYSVMLLCWAELPHERPTFGELVSYLEPSPEHPPSVYVDIPSNPKLPPMSEYVPMKSLLKPFE